MLFSHKIFGHYLDIIMSKIMVTWIFGHYHIVLEMHSMWFGHGRCKSQVLCKEIKQNKIER